MPRRNERIRRSVKIKNRLIYCGTFDPPHYGHIYPVQQVQAMLDFERVIFLPCKSPVLKKNAIATTEQRLEMLALALAPYPSWTIDCREITRETPSFMVNTLESFRKEYGPTTALSLLMGADAFLELPQWHRWQDILALSHLIIMHRTTSMPLSKTLHTLLLHHETKEKPPKIYHISVSSPDIFTMAQRL